MDPVQFEELIAALQSLSVGQLLLSIVGALLWGSLLGLVVMRWLQ